MVEPPDSRRLAGPRTAPLKSLSSRPVHGRSGERSLKAGILESGAVERGLIPVVEIAVMIEARARGQPP